MNPLRTTLQPGVSKHTFSLRSSVLTAGSCFAEAIGARLHAHKIPTLINPFGVIYNPHSIHKSIKYALFNEGVQELTFLEADGLHLSYDFHSSVFGRDQNELRRKITDITGAAHHFIKDANVILLTYGTAWVYERNDTGEIVANCHKVPPKEFTKTLLSQKQIISSFQLVHNDLKRINPDCRVILTVSPVRHVRDTLEGNSVSKAILRAACETLSRTGMDVEYFPAFEIMIDDLRDYRFYKRDMIHPTEEAEDYIWDHFVARYFDDETKDFFARWSSLRAALAHRPFHPQSGSHQAFLRETLAKLEAFQSFVNVDKEIDVIRKQLVKEV